MEYPDPKPLTNAQAKRYRELNEDRIQALEEKVNALIQTNLSLIERLHFEEAPEPISWDVYSGLTDALQSLTK